MRSLKSFLIIISLGILGGCATPDRTAIEPSQKSKSGGIEKMCFGYAKKGWEIIYTAKSKSMDQAAALRLAEAYFPANQVREQQALISRAYSGEFSTPEAFATFLQNKCFAELPRHPDRIQYSDSIAKSCYAKLVFPQYAYAKKYGEKVTEESALQSIESISDPVRVQLLKAIIHEMYASNDPEDNVNVYWGAFDGCVRNSK